tara:strand:- start:143 stop:478 length:336 start_codon:yes stop_codon:yes gene_type:complete
MNGFYEILAIVLYLEFRFTTEFKESANELRRYISKDLKLMSPVAFYDKHNSPCRQVISVIGRMKDIDEVSTFMECLYRNEIKIGELILFENDELSFDKADEIIEYIWPHRK